MVAKGGRALLAPEAVAALKRQLIPQASLLTPNPPEAEVLARMAIPDLAAMRLAAESLLTLGSAAVLLKGGHLPGDTVFDVLATASGIEEFRAPGSRAATPMAPAVPSRARSQPGSPREWRFGMP